MSTPVPFQYCSKYTSVETRNRVIFSAGCEQICRKQRQTSGCDAYAHSAKKSQCKTFEGCQLVKFDKQYPWGFEYYTMISETK